MLEHVAKVFGEPTGSARASLEPIRVAAVQAQAWMLVGVDLEDLVTHINRLAITRPNIIGQAVQGQLEEVAGTQGSHRVPSRPARTGREGIDPLRSPSDSPPGKKILAETQSAVGGRTQPAFDCHFHLDRGWKMTGRMDRQRFIEMRLPTPTPRNPVDLKGGVMVHCDPGTWLSAWALQEPPRGSPWVTAIGVHPKKCPSAGR
ncbi:Hypothetical predicted protein [Mytilus galloprovincialis]|uniref:Uncharacterized protein n=1 Tax=Mytilus galloprovincialis TaxID=29158 RepID=A0A8B6CRB7_MYTGA|nr:Hypothetical predicted protein [Mytilus galloprovincialis]